MSLLDYINALGDWVLSSLDELVFSAVAIVVVYVFYKIAVREIKGLKAKERPPQRKAQIHRR